jgi:hypothetical protein
MHHADTADRVHIEQIDCAVRGCGDEALLAVLGGDAGLVVVIVEGVEAGARDLDVIGVGDCQGPGSGTGEAAVAVGEGGVRGEFS